MSTLIASLFNASDLAASFDAECIHAAASGRVHRGFAFLAAQSFGLLTTHDKGGEVHPIGKPAFLKLAKLYRETLGQGSGLFADGGKVKGYKQRAHIGAALDAIAQAFDPATPGLRELSAWVAACAPEKKPAKPAAAPAVQGEVKAPAIVQDTPAPTISAEGAANGLPTDAAPAPTLARVSSMPAAELLAAVLAALDCDEFSAEEVSALQSAVSKARSRMSVKATAPGALAVNPAELAPV